MIELTSGWLKRSLEDAQRAVQAMPLWMRRLNAALRDTDREGV
jgi:hypothetical protein